MQRPIETFHNRFEDLPTWKGKEAASVLFLIMSKRAVVDSSYIRFPLRSPCVMFTDRPHRTAMPLRNGLQQFVALYRGSDFVEDPPNATVSGSLRAGESEQRFVATVVELATPVVEDDDIVLPIAAVLVDGEELPEGEYENLSVVVDNWFGVIGTALETVGGAAATAVLATTTTACLTVGEGVSLGLATPACLAALAATGGAATATAGAGVQFAGELKDHTDD